MYYVRHNKYNAKKTVYNGRKYDSKLEAGVAQEIDLLIKAGQVSKVEPQKTLLLYGKNGNRVAANRVDFLVTFTDGHIEIWEAKGAETESWRIKRNLIEDNYPEYDYYIIKQNTRYYVGSQKHSNQRFRKDNQRSSRAA